MNSLTVSQPLNPAGVTSIKTKAAFRKYTASFSIWDGLRWTFLLQNARMCRREAGRWSLQFNITSTQQYTWHIFFKAMLCSIHRSRKHVCSSHGKYFLYLGSDRHTCERNQDGAESAAKSQIYSQAQWVTSVQRHRISSCPPRNVIGVAKQPCVNRNKLPNLIRPDSPRSFRIISQAVSVSCAN